MHIKVEVSTVTGNVTIAGVQQPIIGQRINEADIRLKDGEATILGGLSSDSDSKTAAGIPGVMNIPALGYLFGSKTKDREQDDILIGLVPHIIRAPDIGAMGERAIASGALDSIHVIRGALVENVTIPPPAATEVPGAAPSANVATPVPAVAPARPAATTPPNVFGPPVPAAATAQPSSAAAVVIVPAAVPAAVAPPTPSIGGPPAAAPATQPAVAPTTPPAETTPPQKNH